MSSPPCVSLFFSLRLASSELKRFLDAMADAELQKRLDEVSRRLGQKVTLVEPTEDQENGHETSKLPDPLQWQRDMISESERDEESKNKPDDGEPKVEEDLDAPKRFFGHDTGPRANVQDAFDDSNFVFGEPIQSTAEFCPWNVVKSYPYSFVGKTNRPHVCSQPFTITESVTD